MSCVFCKYNNHEFVLISNCDKRYMRSYSLRGHNYVTSTHFPLKKTFYHRQLDTNVRDGCKGWLLWMVARDVC